MYTLTVYRSDASVAVHTYTANNAADVLAAIPRLLSEHEGCERIKVSLGGAVLFSVDCAGQTLPG